MPKIPATEDLLDGIPLRVLRSFKMSGFVCVILVQGWQNRMIFSVPLANRVGHQELPWRK